MASWNWNDRFPVWNCESDDDSEPMDRMHKVACILIAPNYNYTGNEATGTERIVHKYLQQVKFLPKNLSDEFAQEIDDFNLSIAKAHIPYVFRVDTQAEAKNVRRAVSEATQLPIDVLFVLFVGHGTESGMQLQNHETMSRVQLHRIVNASGFSGTLIEVFCMCYACGTKYQPIADTCGTTQLTPLEKRNTSRLSIFSSTFYPQTFSRGLAFLRSLRDILFRSDSKYVDLTPEALTPPQDITQDEAFDDLQMKKSDVTTVNVCGHEMSQATQHLGDLLIFEPIPSMV